MRIAFLISGLVEIIGAGICYMYPDLLYQDGTPYLMRLYGINALVLGIINLVLFHYYEPSDMMRKIFLAMMFFHGAIAMMTYGSKLLDITYPQGIILTHLATFVLFFIMYMRDMKPEPKEII